MSLLKREKNGNRIRPPSAPGRAVPPGAATRADGDAHGWPCGVTTTDPPPRPPPARPRHASVQNPAASFAAKREFSRREASAGHLRRRVFFAERRHQVSRAERPAAERPVPRVRRRVFGISAPERAPPAVLLLRAARQERAENGSAGSPSPPRSPRTCCRLASPHDVVDTRAARAIATASTCAECRRTCRPPALRYSREDATIASNAPPVSASAFAVFFSARASDVPFRVSDPFRGAPSPGLSTPFSTPSFVSFTLDAHAPSKSSAAEWKPVASPDPKLPALDDDASYGQSARSRVTASSAPGAKGGGSVTETRLR